LACRASCIGSGYSTDVADPHHGRKNKRCGMMWAELIIYSNGPGRRPLGSLSHAILTPQVRVLTPQMAVITPKVASPLPRWHLHSPSSPPAIDTTDTHYQP
jgi:hypothetical protein